MVVEVPRILFLMPKDIYKNWPIQNDFSRRFNRIPSVTYPLLAALSDGFECDIFDGLVRPISLERYCELIRRYQVVCINCVSSAVALNTEVNIRLIKRLAPGIKIVLGGQHATFFSQEWLSKGADFVVRGEAEIAFPKLLRAIRDNAGYEAVAGLSYTLDHGRKTFHNPDQEFIADLDQSPMPRWDKLDFKPYDLECGSGGYTATLETARGCRHNCNFCVSGAMWQRTQRYKSIPRVLAEIKALYGLGVREIFIADDNFGSDASRVMSIFDAVLRSGLKINFKSFLRADVAVKNPDLLSAAARAGLKEVFIGFESLNEQDLKLFAKGYSTETVGQYQNVYKELQARNIAVHGLFLLGYPGQKELRHPYRLYQYVRKICDVGMFADYQPNIGLVRSHSTYNIGETVFKTGNMFYYDRTLVPFTINGQRPRNRSGFMNLLSLFPLLNIDHFLKRTPRGWILRRIYKSLVQSIAFEVDLKMVRCLLIRIWPFMSVDKKLQLLWEQYAGDRQVGLLLKKANPN